MKPLSEIPWEIWHPIFREVYADAAENPLPAHLADPKYVLTPLNKRLLVHRNLSLVAKHFHRVSSSVFLEELDLHTPESLHGVSNLVKDPVLARVVRRLSFDFWSYRCGASAPRRIREHKDTTLDDSPELLPPDYNPIAQAEYRHRRAVFLASIQGRLAYKPSGTRQRQHYVGWTGFVRSILSACTGALYVSIDFKADYAEYARRPSATANYRTLFGAPDIVGNHAVFDGLACCTNLRRLDLVDPSPLDEFGPALVSWPLLEHISITLSPEYPEARRLEEAVFTPPKHLKSFKLANHSNYKSALPTSSNLSHCVNLERLQLGDLDLSNIPTILAASYIISTYQHSLTHLHLSVRVRQGMRDISALLKYGNIHFPRLRSLVIEHGECSVSLFASIRRADALEEVDVHRLRVSHNAEHDFGEGGGVGLAQQPWQLVQPDADEDIIEDTLDAPIPTLALHHHHHHHHEFNPHAEPTEDAYWHTFFSLPAFTTTTTTSSPTSGSTSTTLRRFHVNSIFPSRAKEAMLRVMHERGIDASPNPTLLRRGGNNGSDEPGGLALNNPVPAAPVLGALPPIVPAGLLPLGLPGFDFGPGLGLGVGATTAAQAPNPPPPPGFGLGGFPVGGGGTGGGTNPLANLMAMASLQAQQGQMGGTDGNGDIGSNHPMLNPPQLFEDEGGAGEDDNDDGDEDEDD